MSCKAKPTARVDQPHAESRECIPHVNGATDAPERGAREELTADLRKSARENAQASKNVTSPCYTALYCRMVTNAYGLIKVPTPVRAGSVIASCHALAVFSLEGPIAAPKIEPLMACLRTLCVAIDEDRCNTHVTDTSLSQALCTMGRCCYDTHIEWKVVVLLILIHIYLGERRTSRVVFMTRAYAQIASRLLLHANASAGFPPLPQQDPILLIQQPAAVTITTMYQARKHISPLALKHSQVLQLIKMLKPAKHLQQKYIRCSALVPSLPN
ncbi:ORF104 [Ranid herpesvirus 1]|uniref:ORF104 n=1 Tax=Ranid herpesvirus 1 TaxID=85655 RepID=Q14VM6_9VIRU|nr:ORF104 [Ranid herpesvirus 1]ABG25776.1 ORF104 [Ranid herpesvirus 1]